MGNFRFCPNNKTRNHSTHPAENTSNPDYFMCNSEKRLQSSNDSSFSRTKRNRQSTILVLKAFLSNNGKIPAIKNYFHSDRVWGPLGC